MAGILDGIGNWLTSPNTPKQQAFFRALSAAGAKGLQSTGASYDMPRSSRQNYGDMLAAFQGSMQDSETRQVGLDKAEREKQLFQQQQETYKRQQAAIGSDPELQKAFDMGGPAAVSKLLEYRQSQERRDSMMKSLGLYPGASTTPAASTAPYASTGTPGLPRKSSPQPGLPPPPGFPAQSAAVPPSISDMPPSIQQMIASGRLPRGEVMLALSSEKPMDKLAALVLKYRHPTSIPKEYESTIKDWRKEVNPYVKEMEGYGKKIAIIEASLKQGTGVGDYAAIQQFQRMIDDAVVRKEDVETIQSAQGVIPQLYQRWEQAKGGTLYSPTLRAEIAAATKAFVGKLRETQVGRLKGMKDMAHPRVQSVWDKRIIGQDFLDRYNKAFDIPTDEKFYQHKADRNPINSAIARRWKDKTIAEITAAQKAGKLTEQQIDLILKSRGL